MYVVSLATKSYLGTAVVHQGGLIVAVHGYYAPLTLELVPTTLRCQESGPSALGNVINEKYVSGILCLLQCIWKFGVDVPTEM